MWPSGHSFGGILSFWDLSSHRSPDGGDRTIISRKEAKTQRGAGRYFVYQSAGGVPWFGFQVYLKAAVRDWHSVGSWCWGEPRTTRKTRTWVRGFLSCGWCISWFTKSCRNELKGLTTNDTKDTNMGAPGFLSCGLCFSWFTDSGHVERKG